MHFSSRQLITLFLKPKFSVSLPLILAVRLLIRSCTQLRMRGQRDPLNENGDGEVDENFWAQAAADQAAGRATSDGEGGVLSHVIQQACLSDSRGFPSYQPETEVRSRSTPSSSTTTMTMALALTMALTATWRVLPIQGNRTCLRGRRAGQDGSDPSLSSILSALSEWTSGS